MPDRVTFAVPGSLDIRTGGYLYDKRIIAGLRERGWTVDVLDVGTGFPHPSRADRQLAFERIAAEPGSAPLVIDGLALGALPEAAAAISERRPLIGLVHHPLFLETGASDAVRRRLYNSERAALSSCHRVVTTSRETRNRVAGDFGYPDQRISTVEPGIDRPHALAPYRGRDHLEILSAGALVPRKGHGLLIGALGRLRHLSWTLRIVGSADLDPAHARELENLVSSLDLHDRVIFTGVISDAELSRHFIAADLFALASEYEGYGIAFAEAVLHGLPVIGTTGGAIRDTVPEGAGILVEPGDGEGLKTALQSLISDPERRRAMAARARGSETHFQSWESAAGQFASILEDI